MGRGLSRFQKEILRMAYANHTAEERSVPAFTVLALQEIAAPKTAWEDVGNVAHQYFQELKEQYGEIGAFSRMLNLENDLEYRARREAKYQEYLQERARVSNQAFDVLAKKLDALGLEARKQFIRGKYAAACIVETDEKPEAERTVQALRGSEISVEVSADYGMGCDLYMHEVLRVCFGFGQHPKVYPGGAICTQPATGKADKRRHHTDHYFNRKAIGEDRYNAASASVSRAFRRLEERNLVIRLWFNGHFVGISLTPQGLDIGKELLVTKGMIVPNDNHYTPEQEAVNAS
jgi:hypothetical protein